MGWDTPENGFRLSTFVILYEGRWIETKEYGSTTINNHPPAPPLPEIFNFV